MSRSLVIVNRHRQVRVVPNWSAAADSNMLGRKSNRRFSPWEVTITTRDTIGYSQIVPHPNAGRGYVLMGSLPQIMGCWVADLDCHRL